MQDKKFTERLKQRLTIEFQNHDRSGAYGFTQRSMAYNSNKIEGSTLTEKQTASLFDTGTFFADDEDTIFRAKDVEEMNGHFKMFNYMMKHVGEPLTADIIKGMLERPHPTDVGWGRSSIGTLNSSRTWSPALYVICLPSFLFFYTYKMPDFSPTTIIFSNFFYACLFIFRATDTKKSQNHSGLDSEILDDSDNI